MGQIIAVFLEAAGVLLLLWALLGWLLSGSDKGGAAVLYCLPGRPGKQEAYLRYYLFLREAGVLKMPLILVDCGLDEAEKRHLAMLSRGRAEVIFCAESELGERMRTEASQHGGNGTAAG